MSETLTLLTTIIPLALGAAVSPTALMGIILLLSISKKPKISGFGYYVGSIILILIVITIGAIIGAGITNTASHPNPLLALVDLIVGVVLVLFGARRIFKSQKSPKNRFNAENTSVSAPVIFIKGLSFGFVMFLINFSTTLIVLEAGKDIWASSAALTGKMFVISILIVITLLVCEIPLLMYLIFPEKANIILSKVNVWMQRNGHILMGLVILVIGVYLIWIGLFRLGII